MNPESARREGMKISHPLEINTQSSWFLDERYVLFLKPWMVLNFFFASQKEQNFNFGRGPVFPNDKNYYHSA